MPPTEPPPRSAGVLRTSSGRLRLGWRLAAWLLVAVVLFVAIALVLPSHVLASSSAMLVAALVAGWALLALEGRRPAALGFHLDRSAASEILGGLALGVGLGLAVVGVIAAAGGARWTVEPGTASDWVLGAGGALAFLTIPAAAEEAFLRGYPLQATAEAWGALPALGVTSVVFGALHVANPSATALGLANVTAAGLFLGVVYLRTGSLWWATGAHLGWNWSHGYLVDVPVSGLELLDAPFYEGAMTGPDWLGGGAFGPEGSAVATVLVLAASLLVWRSGRLSPAPAALAAGALPFVGRTTGTDPNATSSASAS